MKRCILQLLPDVFIVYITLIGVVTTKKREKKFYESWGGGSTHTVSKLPPAPGSCVLAPMTAVSTPLNEFEYEL